MTKKCNATGCDYLTTDGECGDYWNAKGCAKPCSYVNIEIADRIADREAQTMRGMSLRDYFAGQALNGYCVHGYVPSMRQVAGWCYEFADAMLKARELGEAK
jgi:hypothetical protein